MGRVMMTPTEYVVRDDERVRHAWPEDSTYFKGEKPPVIHDQLVKCSMLIVGVPKDAMLIMDQEQRLIRWQVNTGRRMSGGHLAPHELCNPTTAWISPFSGRAVLARMAEHQLPPFEGAVVAHRRGHLYFLIARGKPVWAWRVG